MKIKPIVGLLALAFTGSPVFGGLFEPSVPSLPARPAAAPLPLVGAASFPNQFRSIDGFGNNSIDPNRGAANIPLVRRTTVAYGDGSGTPAGGDQRSARDISNLVVAQDHPIYNTKQASDFIWQWGQFIDHDIDLTPSISPIEPFNIPVPAGDPYFDPDNTGTQTIELDRSLYQMINGVRQQVNTDTAYIDGSQVYGSDTARALELRRLDGSGKLKTSPGDLLPYNVDGFPNAPDTSPIYFLAGDVRANEQLGLTAMHTLFMREHNFWADVFHAAQPYLDDEGIYQRARAMVAAEIQVITYRDFLPLLLGRNALPRYRGYRPQVDASIENVFSTAAYRVGHTMLSDTLRRLDSHNHSIGDLSLAECFFNPAQIPAVGIDCYLRGLASQRAQEVDAYIVDPVRNFLFGQPGQGGFDLASLNIQRGRDHGLPRYNRVRMDFGLPPYTTFAQMNPDHAIQVKLASAYNSVNDIDIWVGSLAEKHRPGAMVSQTTYVILKDQFQRLRDGDRFWYQTYLPRPLVAMLEHQSLADIIRRNTGIHNEMQNDVFRVANH